MRSGNDLWDLPEARWAIRRTETIRGGDRPVRTFCCTYHEDGRKSMCHWPDCSKELRWHYYGKQFQTRHPQLETQIPHVTKSYDFYLGLSARSLSTWISYWVIWAVFGWTTGAKGSRRLAGPVCCESKLSEWSPKLTLPLLPVRPNGCCGWCWCMCCCCCGCCWTRPSKFMGT